VPNWNKKTERQLNNMNCKPWTLALLSAGLVSLPAVSQADESKATPAVMTALSATTLSGYVDTSAQWNFGTGNGSLPATAPNGAPGSSKADGFNFNVFALTLSHPPGEGDWAAGYNATLLYGPDAVGYNNTFGSATSDFSLKDAYVELKSPVGNGLDFKIGTFAQPLGYEVYETGNNPNYTRSYGYEIEPTSLTGIMLAYTFCPVVSMNAGVANTWNAGIDSRANPPMAESYKAYFGSLTFTAPKDTGFLEGSTLSMGAVNGFDKTATFGDKTSLYIGGALKTPIKELTVGVAYDYVMSATPNAVNASGYQNAIGAYAVFQATEKLSFNTRAEYMSQSSHLVASSGLQTAKALEITESINYQLWKNVISRLEFRWDHDATDSNSYSTGLDNVFMLAANIIYKF
jgi:hypothetical protein